VEEFALLDAMKRLSDPALAARLRQCPEQAFESLEIREEYLLPPIPIGPPPCRANSYIPD
jgi:hypothetical protein